MTLESLARRLPEEVWAAFEPVLPPRPWCGNGRPPYDNRDGLHAVIYLAISGIGWKMLPPCFPCYKTVQERLDVWLKLDAFRHVWSQCVARHEVLRGINFDQLSIDGSRKPAQKGGRQPAPIQLIEVNVGPKSSW
jgi:transposase